ncbi:MAG: DUF4905 domain-containing protein [Cyclobacteriaceae bacterium]
MEDNRTLDFSFEVSGKIWKLVIDEYFSQLALEVRDDEEQELSFLVFNVDSLTISDYLQHQTADWWTTLVAVRERYLFLDQYTDPQDPTSKALMYWNWENGQAKSLEDFQLLTIDGDKLGGTSASDRSINKVSDTIDLPQVGEKNQIDYPDFYSSDTQTHKLVCDYLEVELDLGIEYFEQAENIIISYYVRSGAKFDRKLAVIKDGEEVFHQVQDFGMEGFAAGAFFILSEYLIFITNSNQINGIKI